MGVCFRPLLHCRGVNCKIPFWRPEPALLQRVLGLRQASNTCMLHACIHTCILQVPLNVINLFDNLNRPFVALNFQNGELVCLNSCRLAGRHQNGHHYDSAGKAWLPFPPSGIRKFPEGSAPGDVSYSSSPPIQEFAVHEPVQFSRFRHWRDASDCDARLGVPKMGALLRRHENDRRIR